MYIYNAALNETYFNKKFPANIPGHSHYWLTYTPVDPH